MHDTTATPCLLHDDDHRATRTPSMRAYLMLLGAAALSGMALHMARSTTAADLPDTLAQHLTRPTDLPQDAINTSLQAIGL
jgi:hypothetical protein